MFINLGQNGKNMVILHPTLDACVETQARRLYNQTVSALLKTPDDLRLQEQLETLQLFLEQADFHKLRAESELLLIDGRKVAFTVWREDGKARWKMNVNL
ncbi:MAG: hypothetical protein Q7T57_07955 [Dehalococcoidales bacterium]|nr:hypothetical protein [Dehalococcoidales bacterium]